ncbi:class I SAM-dependent methyltransferase [Rhodococcus sp. HNM0569]|uniref:class I SAM-dependent methyltransferase n=1 Tax=Rhodococcus sp. HNM0569 TaxID=2716340 RepID=UPI00146CF3A1|nr:class I SAM-dependent methyltransferase [Rhodococcus sp. HNM0569]NLU83388.1 class I SAM-dependent methyltransferase [Rhodococcus sp. HNM0569]
MSTTEYFADDRRLEHERLMSQSRVFDPLTRRLFDQAGLHEGMRVLDLGSGAGNVALLASEYVGPSGSVVGVERDPEAVEHAQEWCTLSGIENIEFRTGDVQTLDSMTERFDAVVGRLILMYLPDPVDALRRAASLLRPDGILCVHEADMTDWTTADSEHWHTARRWVLDAFERVGTRIRMGPSLYSAFLEAGLPEPRMTLEAEVGGGDQAPVFGWANAVIAAAPLLERLGIATAEQVDAETLTARLTDDMVACNAIVSSPLMYGAYCRV